MLWFIFFVTFTLEKNFMERFFTQAIMEDGEYQDDTNKSNAKTHPDIQTCGYLRCSVNLAFAKTHIASNVQTLANLFPNLLVRLSGM